MTGRRTDDEDDVPEPRWGGVELPAETPWQTRWRRLRPAVIGVGVVVALLLIGPVMSFVSRAGEQTDRGRCVELSGTRHDVTVFHVDCEGERFNWLVAKVVTTTDDCPGDQYAAVYSTPGLGPATTVQVRALCLVPNLKVDRCYVEYPADEVAGYGAVECGAPEPHFRVAAVHQQDRAGLCQPDTTALTFPEPPRTYCLADHG